MPPIKPDACLLDGQLAIFIGEGYKLMGLDVADSYVRKLQGLVAEMKRAKKRAKRKSTAKETAA